MTDRWDRLAVKRREEARQGIRDVFDPEKIAARARRRAAAVNRRLERDVPLLVSGGVVEPVTEAQAVEQLVEHDAAVAEHLASIDRAGLRMAERAAWLRAFCAAHLTPAQLAEHDAAVAKRPPQPAYAADLWGNLLRELNPAWATQCGHPPFDRLDVFNLRGAAAVGRADPEYLKELQADLAMRDEATLARHGEQLALGIC